MYKLLVCFCLLCLWGCDLPWKKSDPVVASVGKTELKLSELKRLAIRWDETSDKQRLQLVDNWLTQEALYQEALIRGVDQEPETKRILELSRKKIVLDRLASRITDSLELTESEVQQYYDAHPESFIRGQNLYSGVILQYTSEKVAERFYRSQKSEKWVSVPVMDSPGIKTVPFDSVKESPDSCLAGNLRKLPLGQLSAPRFCQGTFKSIVVLSSLDSLSQLPLSEVYSFAENLARGDKRHEKMKNFKTEIKNKRAIFTYPDLFCRPGEE
jgi:hypothetical protein